MPSWLGGIIVEGDGGVGSWTGELVEETNELKANAKITLSRSIACRGGAGDMCAAWQAMRELESRLAIILALSRPRCSGGHVALCRNDRSVAPVAEVM